MDRIFVSYRRSDNQDATGRIYDRLLAQFGKDNVFKDIDSIPLGVDFRKHLSESVGRCRVLIVIVGANWLNAQDENAKRRLDSPNDFVRIEIEAALARGIPVIPVLVGNALMPGEADVPPSISPLVYRQGVQVRPDPDFHRDMDRLCTALRQILASPDSGRTKLESSSSESPETQTRDADAAAAESRARAKIEEVDGLLDEPTSEELQAVRNLIDQLVMTGPNRELSNLASVSRGLQTYGGREVLILCKLLADPKISEDDKWKTMKLLAVAIRQPQSKRFLTIALDTLFDHGILVRSLQKAALSTVMAAPVPGTEKWARLLDSLSVADESLIGEIVSRLGQVIPPAERQRTGATLVELLDTATNWWTFTSICNVLENIGYRAGVPKLISILECSPPQKAASISGLLTGWQVKDASPAIRQGIENIRYGTSPCVPGLMKHLYALEGSVASPYLAEVLRDAVPALQKSILQTLGEVNDSVFVDVVADLAANSLDKEVRTAAHAFVQKKQAH